MTGLDKILKSIDDEAAALAEKTISEARLQAEEILAQAKVTIEEEKAKILTNMDARLIDIAKATASQVVIKSQERMLRAKSEAINQTIDKAKSVLCGLPDEDYFKIIETLFEKHMLPKRGEMIFSQNDLKRLPSDFKENISKLATLRGGQIEISEHTRDIDGGFILVYGDIEEIVHLRHCLAVSMIFCVIN